MEQDVALGRKLLAEAAKEDVDGAAMDTAVMAATAAAAVVEERLRKRNDINTLHAAIAAAAEVSSAAKATGGGAPHRHTGEPFPPMVRLRGAYLAPGIMACSHPLCGRVETRRHEFRRWRAAAACDGCSRSCQSGGDCSTNSRACPCSSCTAGSSPTSNRKIQARGRDRTAGAMDAVHAPAGDAYAAEVSSGR